ncbi:hypothetical protein VTJ04DRAFT_5433, partial [Mycothermus thermophilus]|uniref:uncharacterized protein n=1 Tax=Humicola insolens TaxID=85995 RepID=UPI0037436DD0
MAQTVSKNLWRTAENTLAAEGWRNTPHHVVKTLRLLVAPTKIVSIKYSRNRYLKHLEQAESATNPVQWTREFLHIWTAAQANEVNEALGAVAVDHFLTAVGKRIAPDWATRKKEEVAEWSVENRHPPPLKRYVEGLLQILLDRGADAKDTTAQSFAIIEKEKPRNNNSNRGSDAQKTNSGSQNR